MNLLNLIPALESLSGPISSILGDDASGLTELAGRLENQDFGASIGSLSGTMTSAIAQALPGQSGSPASGAVGLIGGLSDLTTLPSDLFSGFEGPLSEMAGFLERVPQLVDLLVTFADSVEEARGGDLSPLIGQVVESLTTVLSSVTGPDFAGFESWLGYLEELADTIRPIIDAGGAPEVIRDQLLTLAVGRIRDTIFSLAPEIVSLRDGAADLLNGLLPDIPGFNLQSAYDDVVAALETLQSSAASGVGDIAALITDYQGKMIILTDKLHQALDALQAALGHPLLTAGGVAATAGRDLDRILAMRVDDYSNVVDRLESFFNDIEQAVDAVDLSSISDGINGFFTQIQTLMEQAGLDAVDEEIAAIRARISDLLDRVQELMVTLTSRVQGWLAGVTDSLDEMLDQLGTVGEDGRFHFSFETELESLYARIDGFIVGDPNNPDAFSIKKSLADFQQSLKELIDTVATQIESLAGQLESAKDQLAESLSGVRTQIESVDPATVMAQANAAMQEAFDAIGNLEFDPIVDPIIAELNDTAEALSQIDLSSLNDLIKAALSAALDAIQTSDFDQEITGVLLKELDELLAYPRQILDGLADNVNALIAKVTAISPQSLFEPVQAQLDRMTAAVDIDLGAVLKPPLQSAMAQLTAQLQALNPAQFLEPLAACFQEAMSAVDHLQPQALLAPLQDQIDHLARQVSATDLSGRLGGVNAVFSNMNAFLDGLDPAVLLEPVLQPFEAVSDLLASFAPSQLLSPLNDIMDQISGLTDEIPDAVITQIQSLYAEALARVDSLDPSLLFDAVRGPFEAFQARFESLQPTIYLTQLQQRFGSVQGAVTTADTRDGTANAAQFNLSAPTMLFASVISRYEPLAARFEAVLDALDPGVLQERYDQARQRMEELMPRALRDNITSSQLRILLDMTNPAQWVQRLDAIYERIMDKVNQISPAILITPLSETYQVVRDAVGAVDIGRIVTDIEEIMQRIGDMIGAISLEQVAAPLLAMVDRLKGTLAGLDPTILIDGLKGRFDQLISLFDEVGPDAIVDELQAAWAGIHGHIEALFDLDALLAPLSEIFDAITALLGGLDIGELVSGVDEKLTKLHDELKEALDRTGTAFKAMLGAIPLDGGGASASVSI